jgi:hypothetical protein
MIRIYASKALAQLGNVFVTYRSATNLHILHATPSAIPTSTACTTNTWTGIGCTFNRITVFTTELSKSIAKNIHVLHKLKIEKKHTKNHNISHK